MEVMEILGDKGDDVITAPPETPVSDIIGILAGERVGVVVITGDQGEPVGIISERDVVRCLGTDGPSVLNMAAHEVMTAGVETCAPNDEVEELMVKMVFGHIRHLPVIDNGVMTGIVSIGDVVKAGMRELKIRSDIISGYIIQPMAHQGGA